MSIRTALNTGSKKTNTSALIRQSPNRVIAAADVALQQRR